MCRTSNIRSPVGDTAWPRNCSIRCSGFGHGLLTVKTMPVLSSGPYGRMVTINTFGEEGQRLLTYHVDQFNGVGMLADGEMADLQGVIEFFQTQINTKMTIAAERLAVVRGGHAAGHRTLPCDTAGDHVDDLGSATRLGETRAGGKTLSSGGSKSP